MDSVQTFNCLDFHDNEPLDEQIHAVSAIKCPAAVDERKRLSSFDGVSDLGQR
jgi:hypothetical protein